ncbi:hypothetical protein TNCV_2186691 [Trichonephila clavipes]|nr:hypothetical protein TNCV_2186691 [Trichonephila clavipes]
MKGRKYHVCAMVQRSTEREQKLQYINGTESILLKGCTATSVQNYDTKCSGRCDSGAAWNSLHSGRFLNVMSAAADIRVMMISSNVSLVPQILV